MRNLCLAVLLASAATLVGCGDDDDNNSTTDAGQDSAATPGVCAPRECPTPSYGVACCTPDARCGADPGFGGCIANVGEAPANVCELDKCEVPPTGDACCLSNGKCGRDPWELGVCFPNPPKNNTDAGGPLCDLETCNQPDEGVACCLPTGKCGVDYTGLGFCVREVIPVDAGVTMPPDGPPDDPSITGECPSYLGIGNTPVWGCCSRWGVCGTFAYDMCLLPPGTQIPVPANDGVDAGIPGRCTPPAPMSVPQ